MRAAAASAAAVDSRSMKRCLLLLLCVLLPLQLAWAGGVGVGCGADHEHHAAAMALDDGSSAMAHHADMDTDAEPCCPDAAADCGHCHGIGAPLAMHVPATGLSPRSDESALAPTAHAATPPPARPERPNWFALA